MRPITCSLVWRSRTIDSCPASCNRRASRRPAGPPPTTTTGTRDRVTSQAPLEPVQRLHRRQALGDARVRLASVADGLGELSVLDLDPVHADGYPGQVDGVPLAVD